MQLPNTIFWLLTTAVTALPLSSSEEDSALPDAYTLTAYSPSCPRLNGLKVNWAAGLNLFQAQVASYCPFTGSEITYCNNGTDTVFNGVLHPLSEVAGGQDSYVREDGFLTITIQHSHAVPAGAYAYGLGWTYNPFPNAAPADDCSEDDLHNCGAPTGYLTFKAPDATVGGVVACPNPNNANVTSIYAVTSSFNQTGCEELEGLRTHNYTGINPPVWAY